MTIVSLMNIHKLTIFLLFLSLTLIGFMFVSAQEETAVGTLTITQTSPAARDLDAPTDTAVSIQFDRPLSTTTVTTETLRIFGRWSGPAEGVIGFADLGATAVFTPHNPFSAGEQVMVVLSNDITANDGMTLTNGFSFQFWTATAVNPLSFQIIDTLTTRTTPGQSTRAYGGAATDMDNDGWLDLSIINEDTGDVRVFLNQADGTGLYHPFLEPPTPVNDRASPNEPADFNSDGNADLVVANINTSSVSILLGNGDGTFAPQQEITVGSQPRGVAVLDVDADGDADIVNTNSGGSGNLSLLLNDGHGVFGSPTYFEGGGAGEWALSAADMNEDGRLDLILSARISNVPSIIIQANNGDGTFSQLGTQNAGGSPWMLNVGDVNGDGHEDVAVVNSSANNGAILLGDGNGNLAPPTTYATDPFPLATDLGDIDGDGDLDWATSSFSGDWWLFLNDGNGNFSFYQEFPATIAASCALMLDFNNDHILDLALIDELADEVILVKSQPPAPPAPIVDVSPTSLSSTQFPDTIITQTVTVANIGTSDLHWQLHETACTTPADVPWLTATPLTGTTTISEATPISVQFDATGLPATSYSANLCLASDDSITPQWTMPVTLTVITKPVTYPAINISPAAITSTQTTQTTTTHTLTISNTGTADLHWQGHETDCAAPVDIPWLTMAPITGTTAVSSSNDVMIMLSSVGLESGTYETAVCFSSNDPQTAVWPIPSSPSPFRKSYNTFTCPSSSTMAHNRYLLAVDIGGTFTDLVLLNQHNQSVAVSKLLTTYPDPSQAVLTGTSDLLSQQQVAPDQIERVIHGTTLVTNTLIERRGVKTALLTTRGFRDALEIGNEGRYDLYDLGLIKPQPLVERRWRLEVDERLDARGNVLRPLDEASVIACCEQMKAEGIAAVAICFLHAYANGRHETRAAEIVRQHLPHVPISLSHQVAPALREYPRTSTTVANAYVQPLTQTYLQRLETGLQAAGITAPLNIMLSNGGTCTVATAAAFPIRLVESGPAGGALVSAYWAEKLGYKEVFAFDMGGTTAKAIMSEKGRFAITTESEVAHVHRFKKGSGLPLLVPMIHMIEIGAGGGSIASLNQLGLPGVGPQSAGSTPGPACYGRGGTDPTVTDADLLLGHLNADHFANGTMQLDITCSKRCCLCPISRKSWKCIPAAHGLGHPPIGE